MKWIPATTALLLITACGGGGGDAGTSPFGGGSSAGCSSGAAASSASGAACPTATAANLSLQLNAPTISNDGSEKITATATATTASGQALSGIPVTFTVDNNAVFTTTGATTSADGTAVATVSVGVDPSNRVVTVKARSGSLEATSAFAVKGAKLAATASLATLAPGGSGTVEFRLTNANDVGLSGQPIAVAVAGRPTVTGTTGVNGDFLYSFTAPATLGALDIVATAGGVAKTQTVVVQASGANTIPNAVGAIQSASVAANPSVVPTNTVGSTVNRTEIRALFVGTNNTPIPNVRVRFDLAGDLNSIGGAFSTGNAVIYSDANGAATTAYIPADRASPTNGVKIRACYSATNFANATDCPNEAVATITVVADPLAVTIGTNAEIYVGTNSLTYQRRFVVLVVDASGRAKGNVDIVPSIDLPVYFKGRYENSAGWLKNYSMFSPPPPPPASPAPPPGPSDPDPGSMTNEGWLCPNEDVNRNGVNEAGEDTNNNGSLEPRKSDVAISLVGGSKTKDDGTVVVQIEYPQNVASWLQVKILVSATGVSGTEGRATWTEILPVPSDVLSRPSSPPFIVSPYGTAVAPVGGLTPCRNPN